MLLLLLWWAGRIEVPWWRVPLLRVASLDDTGSLKQLNPTTEILNHLSKQSINILVCVCVFFLLLFSLSRHISTLRPSPVSQRLIHSPSVMCDVESLQESLEGPPHDLRDWITLFSFFLSLSLSLLSLWFSYFWLFRVATHRAEPIGNSALITRWMRADWLIEIINTWQWWTSSSFQFLPFSFSSTRCWNLDVWHSKRWKGSALNIQFRPFHQVQLIVAVRVYWFRFVSTCVHAEYGNAEREQNRVQVIFNFYLFFGSPVAKCIFMEKTPWFFRLGIAPNRKQHTRARRPVFFFFHRSKKGNRVLPKCRSFHLSILFRCKFSRGGGAVQPAASTKVLLCRDVSLSINFKLLIGNFGRLEVSERGENKERLFWSTQTRFSTKRKYGSVR